MLRFLLHRPVAVLMTTLGLCILGLVVLRTLPISLLPDIAIPRITVQAAWPDRSAAEIEQAIVAPLRNRLLQVGRLTDIRSESRNGSASIQLTFGYGTNTDLAFIEVNEQIDQISGLLPREAPRPRVVKANVSDLPVFYLSMVPREGADGEVAVDPLELSEFARAIVRRRLEQLPEVAFVDLSGLTDGEIRIRPDRPQLQAIGLTDADISRALEQNNLQLGNILLRDGQYQYAVRFASRLQSAADIEHIYLQAGGRSFRLGDLAEVSLQPHSARGRYRFQGPADEPPGRAGLIFSVRKRADARLFSLQASFAVLLADLRAQYPHLDFYVTNDQSDLLRVSIDNLFTSLLYGAGFAFLVLLLFFREWRAPLLIALVIPVSLVISLFGLYLAEISINVISLAGLILGVGLMIDNSIIVIENIRQQRRLGFSLSEACIRGGEEVIRPLLSSALTTCSVFLPLIFLSGLAGALFYDQALSVALALGASLLAAYLLLPVLVRLLEQRRAGTGEQEIPATPATWLTRAGRTPFARSVDLVLRYRWLSFLAFVLFLAWGAWRLREAPKALFPPLTRPGLEAAVDWNAAISLEANEARVAALSRDLAPLIDSLQLFAGEQQFLLNDWEQQINEARLFVFPERATQMDSLEAALQNWMRRHHPEAALRISPLKNIFDQVFGRETPPLIAHLQAVGRNAPPEPEMVAPLVERLREGGLNPVLPVRQQQYAVRIDRAAALRYQVPYDRIYERLRTLFNENEINSLQTGREAIPIVLGQAGQESAFPLLETATVNNEQGAPVPLRYFIRLEREEAYKSLQATRNGPAYPIRLDTYRPGLEAEIRDWVRQGEGLTVQFTGAVYEDRRQILELLIVSGVALLLLYLILAAQFESLLQPLIVLLTVPAGLAGALTLLWLAGESLNLIAVIGMTVMGGIVVNDAILKIDMMNRLRAEGHDLSAVIHGAGYRRLRPILMTSLTTILALGPVLFSTGLGAELQRPLAWAVIGGLIAGTLASLYLLPLLYHLLMADRSSLRDPVIEGM